MGEIHPLVMQLSSLAASIATVVAVGVAIWAGYRAYNVWKDQLTGTAEYDLACDILKIVYKIRNEIRDVISLGFFYTLQDTTAFSLEYPTVGADQLHLVRRAELLEERMPGFCEMLSELELKSIEAEILYGEVVRERLRVVMNSARWYYDEFMAYRAHIVGKEFEKAEKLDKEIFEPSLNLNNQDEASVNFYEFPVTTHAVQFEQRIKDLEEDLSPFLKK